MDRVGADNDYPWTFFALPLHEVACSLESASPTSSEHDEREDEHEHALAHASVRSCSPLLVVLESMG